MIFFFLLTNISAIIWHGSNGDGDEKEEEEEEGEGYIIYNSLFVIIVIKKTTAPQGSKGGGPVAIVRTVCKIIKKHKQRWPL